MDTNLIFSTRVALVLLAAMLGAIAPSLFRLGWSGRGWTIRAGTALTLALLAYFFIPTPFQLTFLPPGPAALEHVADIGQIARNFLKNDYPTTVDMAKSFLTLIAGVLVFSLTFSEKIIDYAKADKPTRSLIISAWVFFILAMTLCGAALSSLFLAAFVASHVMDHFTFPFQPRDFVPLATIGWSLMCASGVVFVLGLVFLLRSAVRSMKTRAIEGGGDVG